MIFLISRTDNTVSLRLPFCADILWNEVARYTLYDSQFPNTIHIQYTSHNISKHFHIFPMNMPNSYLPSLSKSK